MSDATVNWSDTEDTSGHPTREFVQTREGRRDLTGAVWLTEESPKALMLFGHGASGDRYQAPIAYLAGRFQKAGVASLSIDGPIHGLRKVGDGARGAFAEEIQRETHLQDMMDDWNEAIALAQGLPEVGTTKLAYLGLSMGSLYGIPLVASRKDIEVATLGLVGVTPIVPQSEIFLDIAKEITIPLLFLMQMEDELFPREGCLQIFDAFGSEDKRMHCNPGLHPEIPAEEIDFAFDFLLRAIEGKHQRRVVNPLAE